MCLALPFAALVVYCEMATSLFVLDDIDADASATFVVPRTHRLRRRPRLRPAAGWTAAEVEADRARIMRDARPLTAAAGSVRTARPFPSLLYCVAGAQRRH